MDNAIYLYQAGKEKEIHANDIKKKKEFKRGTLICPECGEDIFFRKGIKHKNHFAHYPENESTIDCDYRISGESDLTIYERLGVPLYLTKKEKSGYQLHIGLKSVDKKTLEIAEGNNAYFELRYGHEDTLIKNIDFLNFIPDQLNLFRIDSYPKNNELFSINYHNLPSSINKWADFVDPIIKGGILFSIHANIGKSIRHGDTIYADEEYLWLSLKKLGKNDILERNMVLDGELILNNQPHYIYKGQFVKTQQNINEFKGIYNGVRERLQVVLLDSKNEILPIWPPARKSKEGYITASKGRNYSVVHSIDKNPKVYMYTDNNYKTSVSPKLWTQDDRIYLSYNLRESDVKLDLNRKLTSTGIDIRYETPNYLGENIKVDEENSDELLLYDKNIVYDLDFSCRGKIKITSLIIDSHKRIKIKNHQDGKIKWRELTYGDIILFFNNNNLLTQIELTRPKSNLKLSLQEIYFISKIPSKRVNLTEDMRQFILHLIRQESRYINCFKDDLRRNRISLRLHKYLQEKDKNER